MPHIFWVAFILSFLLAFITVTVLTVCNKYKHKYMDRETEMERKRERVCVHIEQFGKVFVTVTVVDWNKGRPYISTQVYVHAYIQPKIWASEKGRNIYSPKKFQQLRSYLFTIYCTNNGTNNKKERQTAL